MCRTNDDYGRAFRKQRATVTTTDYRAARASHILVHTLALVVKTTRKNEIRENAYT